MVREVSAELRNSGFVVKTGLRVKFNVSVVMQEDDLKRKQSKFVRLTFSLTKTTKQETLSPLPCSHSVRTQRPVCVHTLSTLQSVSEKSARCSNANLSITEKISYRLAILRARINGYCSRQEICPSQWEELSQREKP